MGRRDNTEAGGKAPACGSGGWGRRGWASGNLDREETGTPRHPGLAKGWVMGGRGPRPQGVGGPSEKERRTSRRLGREDGGRHLQAAGFPPPSAPLINGSISACGMFRVAETSFPSLHPDYSIPGDEAVPADTVAQPHPHTHREPRPPAPRPGLRGCQPVGGPPAASGLL